MKETINFSTQLPADITVNILSRLPADSIIQCCRCVCKTWRALIDDPSFVDTHTRHVISSSTAFNLMKKGTNNYLIISTIRTPISVSFRLYDRSRRSVYHIERSNSEVQFVEYSDAYNTFQLKSSEPIVTPQYPFPLDYEKWGLIRLSSCNGLVFIGSSKPNVKDVFVYNPFTREYVNLFHNHKADNDDGYMVYGFGYHPSSNVYKVVSIYVGGSDDAPSPGLVSVYTLGSGSGWRYKGEVPYKFFSRRPGMLANGAIHWMNKDDDDNEIIAIVSFDLADEKFRIVPSPPAPPSSNYLDQLGVLGGCLCVTRSYATRCKIPTDIWILDIIHNGLEKEEYSWNMKFSIPWKSNLSIAEQWKSDLSIVEPRAILNNGRLLCRSQRYIIFYDPKTEEQKCQKPFNPIKNKSDIYWYEIVPYMKSFVSLKALGEEDAKYFGRRASIPLDYQLSKRKCFRDAYSPALHCSSNNMGN